MGRKSRLLLGAGAVVALGLSLLWLALGPLGFNVLVRHGGGYWLMVGPNSARLSPAMRLALTGPPKVAAGAFAWRSIKDGFEVADLPVVAEDAAIDHILLARIDPRQFRFVVRNAPNRDRGLDQWMTELGAALVINGSYFSQRGEPDTPVISEGAPLGPKTYDAKAGAFVASAASALIHDLAHEDWKTAFRGADNAMVSYPLLLSDGAVRVARPSRWLANRSFIGQDAEGRIIIGTTTDAFFSLERLGRFLLDTRLGLTIALNLDGGPVACQGISLNGFERKTYGRWEAQVDDQSAALLLTWPYRTIAMPIVLAVFPR